MPDKQRGDVEFMFQDGYLPTHSHFSGLQFYHLFEREVSVRKPLPSRIKPQGFFLWFCMTGRGTVEIGDHSVEVAPDTVIITSADHPIVLSPSADSGPLRYICVNFDVSSAPQNNNRDEEQFSRFFSLLDPFFAVPNAHAVRHCLSLFIAELCASKSSIWLIMGYLDQLLVIVQRASLRNDAVFDSDSSSVQAVGHTVYAIIRYVDDHLYTMSNLMDMARDLGYSYNYLSHVFRKKTGITIQAYVSRKKIEHSTELLRKEHLSITEIAAMLNYDCIQSFSKAFKKVMNMSPTEYRAIHGITE